jgi:hypothetical protein
LIFEKRKKLKKKIYVYIYALRNVAFILNKKDGPQNILIGLKRKFVSKFSLLSGRHPRMGISKLLGKAVTWKIKEVMGR